jgi:hypothetical protein
MSFVAKWRKNTWTIDHDDDNDQRDHYINTSKSEIPPSNHHQYVS